MILAILANPVARWTAGLAAVVGAGWLWLHFHDAAIRDDVRTEIEAAQLADDLNAARADAARLETKVAEGEAAIASLNSDLATMASKVQAGRTTIRERIVSGELPNGQIAPVPMVAVDQAQALRGEVLAEDK